MKQNRCDRFAMKHFKYNVNEYIFEKKLKIFNERLNAELINFETFEC